MKDLPTRIYVGRPVPGFANRQSWFQKAVPKRRMVTYIREDRLTDELKAQIWMQNQNAMGYDWGAGFRHAINEMLAWLRTV